VFSLKKTHEIQKVDTVTWSQEIVDQINLVRESATEKEAIANLEKNDFPIRVLEMIPVKARELNLPWAEKSIESLYLFSTNSYVHMLDENSGKKMNVKLKNFEPGFMVKHNNVHHYYFLQTFMKVLIDKDLEVIFTDNYVEIFRKKEEERREKDLMKIADDHVFNGVFYPCLIHDDIDYWTKFAKAENVKLIGRFAFSDYEWDEIPYDETQYYLDMGYVIALDFPKGSSFITLNSGEMYIQTPGEKMPVNFN